MPTTLLIAGWKAVGLRCPDHEITLLHDEQPGPVTLIQMPNGTGKTTTLSLLRAALAGRPLDGPWNRERLLEFRKKDPLSDRGTFTLHLIFNGRRLTIEMTFDFDIGAAPRYTTTYGSGMQDGFQPPRDLQQFFRPEFVSFFVFDGELANNLLNRQQTQAKKVIESLFQLGLLTSLFGCVNQFWQDAASTRGATEERGLTRRKNRVNQLQTLVLQRKRERTLVTEQLERDKNNLKERQQKFADALTQKEELQERLIQATSEQETARAAMESTRQLALDDCRNPQALSAAFAREMVAFKDSLDRVKLPESTAREFFEELAVEKICICGRPLDEQTSAYIREQASHYLGSDDMILLNQVKTDIARFVGSDPSGHETRLSQEIQNLVARIRRQGEARTTYEAIVSEGIQDDPELEQAREYISELKQTVKSSEEKLDRYNQASAVGEDDHVFSIAELEKREKEAKDKYDEIRGTRELRKKNEILQALLSQAASSARLSIHSEIRDLTNQRIAELLPNNAIRVSEIDNSIRLSGQDTGSVGETLSVGYAFLATLFGRTEQNRLPFVVDSPAGSLDLRVRAKVAALIPKLSHQYTAFTISTEREGFLDPLEAATNEQVRYITLFRKGDPELDAQARAEKSVEETVDGYCVVGRDFFRSFHLETERLPNAL